LAHHVRVDHEPAIDRSDDPLDLERATRIDVYLRGERSFPPLNMDGLLTLWIASLEPMDRSRAIFVLHSNDFFTTGLFTGADRR
jgi:hypothetical protein